MPKPVATGLRSAVAWTAWLRQRGRIHTGALRLNPHEALVHSLSYVSHRLSELTITGLRAG
jgi:hypothetical protein